MSRPCTFERVYAAIKQRLCEGVFRPGERLEPAILADELNSSVTPVRDALHRLTGERLVEAPNHNGFRAPMLTESMLRHLYAWHLDLLLFAAMRRPKSQAGAATSGERARSLNRQNEAFERLVRSTGNPEHFLAFLELSQRLKPLQRLEQEFLDSTEREMSEILEAFAADDRRSLRRSLVRYHRRRHRIVPELLARLHAS